MRLAVEETKDGEPCYEWLKMYNLADLYDQLKCETLADVREFVRGGHAASFDVNEDRRKQWNLAISEFEQMFPLNEDGEAKGLAIVDMDSNERVSMAWWPGCTIHLDGGDREKRLDINDEGLNRPCIVYPGGRTPTGDLRIAYNCGRYFFHIVERDDVNREPMEDLPVVYMKLGNRPHWLQPDDAFRIGALEFSVLRFNTGCYRACKGSGLQWKMQRSAYTISVYPIFVRVHSSRCTMATVEGSVWISCGTTYTEFSSINSTRKADWIGPSECARI